MDRTNITEKKSAKAKLSIKIIYYEDFSADIEESGNATNNAISFLEQKEISKPAWRNQGLNIRLEFLKSCKRIALEENRKLYEVIDEALAQYLARYAELNQVKNQT